MAQRSNPLSCILYDNRLTGPNFSDWLRNLRIVLNLEHIGYVLDSKIPSALPPEATKKEHDTLRKWHEDDMQAKCYMLASMTNQLQKQHEKMQTSFEILSHLQELFGNTPGRKGKEVALIASSSSGKTKKKKKSNKKKSSFAPSPSGRVGKKS
ncbi:uncharacterized protein LOC131182929 [Hevea brasiliensis]|uniref:uncharacterized protein LOC131182929 n=1 Tax=Hevea brasiliensis TaxID=3981 RepID=UPI0025CEA021|nr:uncharacterized protein LOC131182929 [Hevea brasiliensis]